MSDIISLDCPEAVDSVAYAASGVIKNKPGVLFGVLGYNDSTSAQFILIFDSIVVPNNDAVPKLIIKVPASSSFSVNLGIYGKAFSIGICWSNSSTGPIKTIGSADIWINALYK